MRRQLASWPPGRLLLRVSSASFIFESTRLRLLSLASFTLHSKLSPGKPSAPRALTPVPPGWHSRTAPAPRLVQTVPASHGSQEGMDGCRSVWRPLWGLGEKDRGAWGTPLSGHGGDAEHGNTLGCLFILNPIRAKSGETGHKGQRWEPSAASI